MYSDITQKILMALQRLGSGAISPSPGTGSAATPPFLPGAAISPGGPPPSVAPTPAAIDLNQQIQAQPETSRVTGGDYLDRLESEITRPMPQWNFLEPQRPGGIRGILGQVLSGVGHGAGASTFGGGLTAAYEGNEHDMQARRQRAYMEQMQQYKNAYDEEANRRANLVKVMQQRRLDAANQATAQHQQNMEALQGRIAGINENRYNEDRAERANRREMDEQRYKDIQSGLNQRLTDTLESLEKRNAATNQTKKDVANIGANARIATGGAGVVKAKDLMSSADQMDKMINVIDKQILEVKNKIGTKATGHRGELLYPPDANGQYPALDALYRQRGKLEVQRDDYRAKADEMMTGTNQPPKAPRKNNPVKQGGGPSSSRRIQLNAPSFRVTPQDDPLGWYQKNRP